MVQSGIRHRKEAASGNRSSGGSVLVLMHWAAETSPWIDIDAFHMPTVASLVPCCLTSRRSVPNLGPFCNNQWYSRTSPSAHDGNAFFRRRRSDEMGNTTVGNAN